MAVFWGVFAGCVDGDSDGDAPEEDQRGSGEPVLNERRPTLERRPSESKCKDVQLSQSDNGKSTENRLPSAPKGLSTTGICTGNPVSGKMDGRSGLSDRAIGAGYGYQRANHDTGMSKYDLSTKKGYDFYEVSSAMQKCIRRGRENEALFWAVELYDSGYVEYAWKRLRIMTSEDVGLAEPGMPATIWALFRMHQEQAKKKEDKNEPQRLFLTHAVLLLCRARKSRMIDWALIWAWLRHPFMKLDVPDFALDKHNERGRRLKRSWAHFFSEGTQLAPHCVVDGEVDMRIQAMKAISDPSGNGLFDEP